MKKLLLAVLLSSSLYCASLYTLDNVHSVNLYFASEAGFLTKEKKATIKDMLTEKLNKAGFTLGETDAPIFVVKVDAIDINGTQAIHIEVGLGEEVRTKRKDEIETFSYTYLANKFIRSADPHKATLDSLTILVDEFIKAQKDDNE